MYITVGPKMKAMINKLNQARLKKYLNEVKGLKSPTNYNIRKTANGVMTIHTFYPGTVTKPKEREAIGKHTRLMNGIRNFILRPPRAVLANQRRIRTLEGGARSARGSMAKVFSNQNLLNKIYGHMTNRNRRKNNMIMNKGKQILRMFNEERNVYLNTLRRSIRAEQEYRRTRGRSLPG